jgi:hypothetical protein
MYNAEEYTTASSRHHYMAIENLLDDPGYQANPSASTREQPQYVDGIKANRAL